MVPYADLLAEIIDLVAEDAERLDCVAEIRAAQDILVRGTSAHRQVEVYEKSKAAGANEREALYSVVDWLAAETLTGISLPSAPGG
jgi:carboxylate-amine ligase